MNALLVGHDRCSTEAQDLTAQRDGLVALGEQPKLNRRHEANLASLWRSGEYTTAELSDLLGVACSTVDRAIQRQGGHASSAKSSAGSISSCEHTKSTSVLVAATPGAGKVPSHRERLRARGRN